MHLNIIKGPLYYDEAKSLIWTDDDIRLEDDQSQPPTVICGRGMEVHLTAAEARPDVRPAAARSKPRTGGFTGVDRIVLKSYVDMNLYVAGGFMSNPPEGKAKEAAPAAPSEKAHVNIYTPGRFEYEFGKDGDVARFDAPEADAAHPHPNDPYVKVIRYTTAATDDKAPLDQLYCQHLELHLSRKEAGPGAHGDAADHNLAIDSAHAVARGDANVVLSSDDQRLGAECYDLQYDARTKLTVLKRDADKPNSHMSADQDGNKIHAREIQIQELPPGPDGKAGRQVTALGPGQIDFCDKNTKKLSTHAAWKDKLVSTKDGAQDLIILSGGASFTDDEHGQSLQADTLKVWLLAAEGGAAPAVAANPQAGRRPSQIEAVGNVSVQSSDLTIPHTGLLVVKFRDVPAGALPAAPPASKPGAPVAAGPMGAKPAPAGAAGHEAVKPAAPGAAPAPAADTAAAAEPEPPRPVSLSARSVYVWVLRCDQTNQLEQLQADGYVEVHQDPAKGAEKGVDVEGEHLDMTYHPEGNMLVVSSEGNEHEDLAKLRMEGIYIIGPEINIDQAANKAWVNGAGAMTMESKADFQGKPLTKPVPLTIYWKKEMFFTGKHALFTEAVQADEDDSRLACQNLRVSFDRPISLKEGNRGGPPPRVKELVCSDNVRVENRTLEGDRLVRYQGISSTSLEMNPLEPEDDAVKADAGSEGNEIRAPGPGELRLFQQGGQDPLAPPAGPNGKVTAAKPDPTKPGKPDEPMKLTYITYGVNTGGGNMYVNTKTNSATFLENVRVLNMPCDDPNVRIDLDEILNHLPEGAMYLQADRLDVVDHGDKKKSQQEMTARGHVTVQAKDFWGHSDTMTYNEAKDQIIFEGGENGLATLFKQKQRGGEPQKIEGKKITYIRSTGMFKIEGGEWISGN